MEVVLLERVGRLGTVGDKVNVKPGFARNYLIPQGKALNATAQNMAEFETRRVDLEKAANERLMMANSRAEALKDVSLSIVVNASDEGKLFGSVGAFDIVAALAEKGVEVCKSEVKLPTGPIRIIGQYTIDLQLHSDVMTSVPVLVAPEGGLPVKVDHDEEDNVIDESEAEEFAADESDAEDKAE